MSCFVVSDFHVDAIVSWAEMHNSSAVRLFGDAAALAAANRAAYQDRYGEEGDTKPAYIPRNVRGMSPVQVLKACDCLAYQCSDWTLWENSKACRALDWIKDFAVSRLPGYDEAAWTLEDIPATCPHCARDLEGKGERSAGLCTSDDCPRHDVQREAA